MKRNLVIVLLVFITYLMIHITTYAKYTIERTFDIADINIDRTRPKLSVTQISNSNVEYPKYANKEQIINLEVEVIEENINIDAISKDKLQILVGNIEVNPSSINISKKNMTGDTTIYQISIKGITGNGNLQIKFKEGAITDVAGWKSLEYIANTDIIIDNIAPQATFTEIVMPYTESEGILTIDEPIRQITNWIAENDNKIFKRRFYKNGTYIYTIIDYAGNQTKVTIQVKKADSVQIII